MPIPGSRSHGWFKKAGNKTLYWYPDPDFQKKVTQSLEKHGTSYLELHARKLLTELGYNVKGAGYDALKEFFGNKAALWHEIIVNLEQSIHGKTSNIAVLGDADGNHYEIVNVKADSWDPTDPALEDSVFNKVFASLDHQAKFKVMPGDTEGTYSFMRVKADGSIDGVSNVPQEILQALMSRWKIEPNEEALYSGEAHELDEDASGAWHAENVIFDQGHAAVSEPTAVFAKTDLQSAVVKIKNLKALGDKAKDASSKAAESVKDIIPDATPAKVIVEAAKIEEETAAKPAELTAEQQAVIAAAATIKAAEALSTMVDMLVKKYEKHASSYDEFLKKRAAYVKAAFKQSPPTENTWATGYQHESNFYESPIGKALITDCFTAKAETTINVHELFEVPGSIASSSSSGASYYGPTGIAQTNHAVGNAFKDVTNLSVTAPGSPKLYSLGDVILNIAKDKNLSGSLKYPWNLNMTDSNKSDWNAVIDALDNKDFSLIQDSEVTPTNLDVLNYETVEVKTLWGATKKQKTESKSAAMHAVQQLLASYPGASKYVANDSYVKAFRPKKLPYSSKIDFLATAADRNNASAKLEDAVKKLKSQRPKGEAGKAWDALPPSDEFYVPDSSDWSQHKGSLTNKRLISAYTKCAEELKKDAAKLTEFHAASSQIINSEAMQKTIDELKKTYTQQYGTSYGKPVAVAPSSPVQAKSPTAGKWNVSIVKNIALLDELKADAAALSSALGDNGLGGATFATGKDGAKYLATDFGDPKTFTMEYKEELARAHIWLHANGNNYFDAYNYTALLKDHKSQGLAPNISEQAVRDVYNAQRQITKDGTTAAANNFKPYIVDIKPNFPDDSVHRNNAVLQILGNRRPAAVPVPKKLYRNMRTNEFSVKALHAGLVVTMNDGSSSSTEVLTQFGGTGDASTLYIVRNATRGLRVDKLSVHTGEYETILSGSYAVEEVYRGDPKEHPELKNDSKVTSKLGGINKHFVFLRELDETETALLKLKKAVGMQYEQISYENQAELWYYDFMYEREIRAARGERAVDGDYSDLASEPVSKGSTWRSQSDASNAMMLALEAPGGGVVLPYVTHGEPKRAIDTEALRASFKRFVEEYNGTSEAKLARHMLIGGKYPDLLKLMADTRMAKPPLGFTPVLGEENTWVKVDERGVSMFWKSGSIVRSKVTRRR